MPWLRFLLVLTCFLICSVRAEAAPAPIVFDFEDGLQGWELHGSAQRVQTQVLGGEWAIFGDGLVGGFDRFALITLISMEADLTEVGAISVDQLLLLDIRRTAVFLTRLVRTDGVIIGLGRRGSLPIEQNANPGTWTFNVSDLIGLQEIALWWPLVTCLRPPSGLNPAIAASFIDNITFHPVPEPGALVLFVAALVGLAALRRSGPRRTRATRRNQRHFSRIGRTALVGELGREATVNVVEFHPDFEGRSRCTR